MLQKHEDIAFYDQRIENLGISNGKYFNSGVMLINYKLWKKENIKNKSISIISDKSSDLVLWDQDVLNILLSDDYLQIAKEYNYRMNILGYSDVEENFINENVFLIHYYGKSKPWSIRGIGFGVSEFYQENYRKLYKEKYQIKHVWKINSFKYFILLVFSRKFFKLNYTFSFIKDSLLSFFRSV